MPVQRGRLKPQDQARITNNFVYLLDILEPEEFIDYLISDFVLTSDDLDEIKNTSPQTRRGRAERLIKILEKSGEHSYAKFVQALEKSGNEHVAKQLETTDVSDVPLGGRLDWIEILSEDVKQSRVTDRHASRLSAALGHGWHEVFIELGLRLAKVQQVEDTYKNSVPTAITNLFIHWRQREASKATFSKLLEAMMKADNRCRIEWDLVQDIVCNPEDA